MSRPRQTCQLTKLLKVVAYCSWSNKRNAYPPINIVPHWTEDVTLKNEMSCSLRTAAPPNARSAILMNNPPTKKVISSWKSLTKEPPSKHRDRTCYNIIYCCYLFFFLLSFVIACGWGLIYSNYAGFWFYCGYGVGFICAWWMVVWSMNVLWSISFWFIDVELSFWNFP
jgi:hypothetical protein